MTTSIRATSLLPDNPSALAEDFLDLTTFEPEEDVPDTQDKLATTSQDVLPDNELDAQDQLATTSQPFLPDPHLRPVKVVQYDENTPIIPQQYAAGFSDADGSFKCVKKDGNIGLQYSAAQSQKGIDALHYLYNHFGGSIMLQLEGDDKNQRAYAWVLNGEAAVEFARLVSKFLLLKKREALRFIDFPMQNLHMIPIIAKNLITLEEIKFDTLKDCKEHFGSNLAFKKRDSFMWKHWEIRKSLTDAEIAEIKTKRQAIFENLRDFKEMPHDEIPLDVKPSDAYFGGFAGMQILQILQICVIRNLFIKYELIFLQTEKLF